MSRLRDFLQHVLLVLDPPPRSPESEARPPTQPPEQRRAEPIGHSTLGAALTGGIGAVVTGTCGFFELLFTSLHPIFLNPSVWYQPWYALINLEGWLYLIAGGAGALGSRATLRRRALLGAMLFLMAAASSGSSWLFRTAHGNPVPRGGYAIGLFGYPLLPPALFLLAAALALAGRGGRSVHRTTAVVLALVLSGPLFPFVPAAVYVSAPDCLEFVADVPIPDGTEVSPGRSSTRSGG
jgi:hypothetical protein